MPQRPDEARQVSGARNRLRPPVDAVIGQLIALFKSVNLGMEPDNPSKRGMISRVVEGVTYYPPAGRNSRYACT